MVRIVNGNADNHNKLVSVLEMVLQLFIKTGKYM